MESKKRTTKERILAIVGIILMPLILAIFIIDRFIMIFLVMSDAPTIKGFFEDMEYIGIATLRTLVVGITIFTIKYLWF